MVTALLESVASGPWTLVVMFLLVLADALIVVVPGEIAVSALGALAVSVGSPPLLAVIAVGALAAFTGDALCYLIGRRIGLERWRWMRARRVQAALRWAATRLDRGTATVVFTARFIPFARLAVNLTAGATRIPAPRYLAVCAVAATAWASYQAVVGAAVGALLPDAPLLAVVVSVAVALLLGVGIDVAIGRWNRRRAAQ
ncbi:DedA family protein [Microbacterium telephonicum]|uniref:Membrane protein DedA with SNARE-associated domain n=1 Tax=Microbacterium telephonicum TaxID=1714841 RepID=A0A498CFD0_9MICO|nr:DedA family protein [Microbacterium telephonicum]RLK52976.1 membrane protein DedA with SNARE-associated domain [Microbacterium telephonicum]